MSMLTIYIIPRMVEYMGVGLLGLTEKYFGEHIRL